MTERVGLNEVLDLLMPLCACGESRLFVVVLDAAYDFLGLVGGMDVVDEPFPSGNELAEVLLRAAGALLRAAASQRGDWMMPRADLAAAGRRCAAMAAALHTVSGASPESGLWLEPGINELPELLIGSAPA